jgi:pilus assembly protein CpaB
MRLIRILGVVLSVLAAAASVWWLRNGGGQTVAEQKPEPVKKLSLVVAAEPLRYAQRITARQVKVIDWMGTAIPADAFETVEAISITEDGPYALSAIAEGVPILRSQLTAPGQKPSLSARLGAEEVAVTIPVNTITGVAGFVLPEERVDVILNRRVDDRHYADVILQNVRVLAVNSVPDASGGEPVQAKSLTFATSREDAQLLEVASGLGEISLVLRSPMSADHQPTRTISDREITGQPEAPPPPPAEEALAVPPAPAVEPPPPPEQEETAASSQVTVIRGVERQEVTVP